MVKNGHRATKVDLHLQYLGISPLKGSLFSIQRLHFLRPTFMFSVVEKYAPIMSWMIKHDP